MKRRVGTLAGLLLAFALLALPSSAQDSSAHDTVVVVLAPHMTWDLIDSGVMPATKALCEDAALGSASVRLGSTATSPDAFRGAAILSAGQPVRSAPTSGTTSELPIGLLADTIHSAGGLTVAIGTSAADVAAALDSSHAQAALVAAGSDGRIDSSETGPRVLRLAQRAPLGVTTDLALVEESYRAALDMRSSGAPLLVVIDPGDGTRAASAPEWESMRIEGARMTDEVVAIARSSLPQGAVLIVTSTAQYSSEAPPGFGPTLIFGSGPGVLVSPATRRDGVLTLPDVTVSILAILGLEPPATMTGSILSIADEEEDADARISRMRDQDAKARALEAVREPAWFLYIDLCVAALAMAFATIWLDRSGVYRAVRVLLTGLLLVLLSLPVTSLVANLFGYPSSSHTAWVTLGIASGAIAIAVLNAQVRRGAGPALGWVALVTVLVIAVDQLTGARLAYGGVFSYSVLFGTRFYGLGNEGAAVLFGALFTGIGMRIDRYGRAKATEFWWAGVPLVLLSVMPFAGANVGVAAWGIAGIMAAYLYGSGRRLTTRTIVIVVAGVFAAVVLAAGIDAVMPGDAHLGRMIGQSGSGAAALAALLTRKAELAWSIFTATPLVAFLPLGIAAVAWLLVRPSGMVGEIVREHPGLGALLMGAAVASSFALITEDSGVAVAALLMLWALATLMIVALNRGEGTR